MFDWLKGGGGKGKGKGRRRTSGGGRRGGGSGGPRRRTAQHRDPANSTEFINTSDPAHPEPAGFDDPMPAPPAPAAAAAAPHTATPPRAQSAPVPAPVALPPAPGGSPDSAATQYHAVGPTGGGVVGILIVKEGTARDEIYKVFDGENAIGRGDEARIRTDARDQSISRVHAQIIHEGGNFGIKPLKEGTNPTFLNDDEVSGGAPLADGDLIRIGNTTLKFRVS